MRLKRILTSTLSVLLLTGFLVTTPAKAAPGSAFADNSKEYQELKQLAQSFQRGGSCYIDDYEAEGALEYVENVLYTGFESQERFNSRMKTAYGELLYDCQTMANKPKEEPKPVEPPKETPKPKETQAEKPKPSKPAEKPKQSNTTKPSAPKQNNNTSSKPKQNNSAPKNNNSNTSTKPKTTQQSSQPTVSTARPKQNNSNTVKETQTVVSTAPKETTKETVKETVVETPKETAKETELETTRETQLETMVELKETQKESDLIKKENTNKKYALVGGGILAISGIIAYIFYLVRKNKK